MDIDEYGVNISNLKEELENNIFIDGEVVKSSSVDFGIRNLTDRTRCSKDLRDNLVIVKGSCYLLKMIHHQLRVIENIITTNRIIVVLAGELRYPG